MTARKQKTTRMGAASSGWTRVLYCWTRQHAIVLSRNSIAKVSHGSYSSVEKVSVAFSYIPKNTKPPMLIHIVRGPMPENRRLTPSSRYTRMNVLTVPLYGTPLASLPSISRVLVTSNGVVIEAATPPAMEPQIAPCSELTGAFCCFDHSYCTTKRHASQLSTGGPLQMHAALTFKPSQRGNWMNENGISRAIMLQ
jgi:hypothetical protein